MRRGRISERPLLLLAEFDGLEQICQLADFAGGVEFGTVVDARSPVVKAAAGGHGRHVKQEQELDEVEERGDSGGGAVLKRKHLAACTGCEVGGTCAMLCASASQGEMHLHARLFNGCGG